MSDFDGGSERQWPGCMTESTWSKVGILDSSLRGFDSSPPTKRSICRQVLMHDDTGDACPAKILVRTVFLRREFSGI